MPEITFVQAQDPLKGKRAAVVATILERLVEAEGEPLTFAELLDGAQHQHQYTPALHALELVGAIERWDAKSDDGKGKTQIAYSLAENVQVDGESLADNEHPEGSL